MDHKTAALIEQRVLLVALRALAVARGGSVTGTAAELYQGLAETFPRDAAADPAMPTCAPHLDHLLRALPALAPQPVGLEVMALPRWSGWLPRRATWTLKATPLPEARRFVAHRTTLPAHRVADPAAADRTVARRTTPAARRGAIPAAAIPTVAAPPLPPAEAAPRMRAHPVMLPSYSTFDDQAAAYLGLTRRLDEASPGRRPGLLIGDTL